MKKTKMRKLCGTILAAATCAAFGDVLTPAASGDVKVLGRPGHGHALFLRHSEIASGGELVFVK